MSGSSGPTFSVVRSFAGSCNEQGAMYGVGEKRREEARRGEKRREEARRGEKR
jgi:hypothetical protein